MTNQSGSVRNKPRERLLGFFVLMAGAGLLSGCGSRIATIPTQQSILLQGHIHGGQQPVQSAAISLYAAGTSGDGLGATSLLKNPVMSDGNGDFNITQDFSCPAGSTPVYIVARGGNPGLASGTNNAALVLMAALGRCDSLTTATNISIDEVTTVAAAWSLAQFLGTSASIGASSNNTTGLANAFAIANLVANTSTGLAPGSGLPSGAKLETAKVYALADVLAACVNSDGGASCSPLFAAATNAGSIPTNTLDAALNIVRTPGANVAQVFAIVSSQAPFQPALATVPNDWTLSVTYGNCTAGCGGLNTPGSVAIDASGNAWIANYFGGVVSRFSPTGTPASPNGFAGSGLRQSYGLTIDSAGSVWVTNEQSVSGANNNGVGSISRFSADGTELSGFGYTSGGVYYPQAIVADSTGAVWVADYGSSSASVFTSTSGTVSGNLLVSSGLPFTTAVALDASHNAWFVVQGGVARVSPSGVVSNALCCNDATGVAVDSSNNVWVADYGSSSLVEISSVGSVLTRVTLPNDVGPIGVAIDGANNVWTGNYYGNSLSKVSGSTASIASPNLGLDAPLSEPYGVAVDASGNLWVTNSGNSTLTQFIGIASPVATPLLGPPTHL